MKVTSGENYQSSAHAKALCARFWNKVEKTETCWLWRAAKTDFGHGVIGVGKRVERAHRVAWVLAGNALDRNECVLHKCDVPACVNPAHLFAGSQLDNIRDMDRKGRRRVGAGERHRSNKLKAAWVPMIRAMAKWSNTERVGGLFRVSGATVRQIVAGKIWRTV